MTPKEPNNDDKAHEYELEFTTPVDLIGGGAIVVTLDVKWTSPTLSSTYGGDWNTADVLSGTFTH